MLHYLLTEADEQRLFKAKMFLNLLEGLANSAQGEPIGDNHV